MASNYLGGGVATPVVDNTQPHDTIAEVPPPITSLQPPATNAGSDDPTGGIAKDAGGLSSTAGIGSPVPNEQQTIVGSVIESVFGKKERTAEEVEAAAPTTATVTTSDQTTSNPGVLGAIAGATAAGGAAIASIIPSMSTTTAEAQVAPSATETTANQSASEGVHGESSTAEAVEATKQQVGAEKVETTQEHEQDPQAAEEAKKKADHEAAVRENKDAIPVAGGEKLGAAHEGESKVIPDTPAPAASAASAEPGISSTAGQPDAVTADNTAKNTPSSTPSGKPKFMDRLKKTLHIGDKKEKS